MSLEINTEWYERGSEMITYFEGKQPAFVIERDMARGDLEAMEQHICEAEALASQNEMEAADVF